MTTENYQELREKYNQRATQHAVNWGENVSEHIIDIIVSVMMTRDNVLQGGSFVQAVVANDLRGAVTRADSDCINHLKLICLAKSEAYI